MKAYEAIVAALEAEGVRNLFGLMGDGNMLIMAEAARRGAPRLTCSRHEGPALAMAVASAVATGGVGVCTVTCGPGLTQLGTGLVDAVRRRVPVVVLAGDLASTDTHINQYFVQRPFVESTGARYIALTSAGDVADVIASAFVQARAASTTVVVGLPMSLQGEELLFSWDYRDSNGWLSPVGQSYASDQDIDAIICELKAAERPVIVAGDGVTRLSIVASIVELGDMIGALMATTLRAKGLFAGRPYDAGIAGAFSTRTARSMFVDTDLVLAIGADLSYFTTEGGYLFPTARVVSINPGEPRFRAEMQIDLLVRADARTVVPRLIDRLASVGHRSTGFRLPEIDDQLRNDEPVELLQLAGTAGTLHPVVATRELDAAAPDDAMFVIGVGHFWSFPIMYLNGRRSEQYHVTYDFGSIGQALPTAIGFATERPDRPTFAIEGDGSLLMHIQELDTLRRSPVPLCVVVMNDENYSAEVHKLNAKGMGTFGATFGGPDFALIAESFGLRGRTICRTGELKAAVAEFLADHRPTVLDVRIDGTVISGPYLRSVFGRDA